MEELFGGLVMILLILAYIVGASALTALICWMILTTLMPHSFHGPYTFLQVWGLSVLIGLVGWTVSWVIEQLVSEK